MKKLAIALVLCILAVPGVFAQGSTVYVSGNPDAYPIEYYDTKSEGYKGLIPELLKKFCEEKGYGLEYLEGSPLDERKVKYKNLQAELISGCTAADGFTEAQWENSVSVITTGADNIEYRILFTGIENSTLKSELIDFMSQISSKEMADILIEQSQNNERSMAWEVPVAITAAVSIGVLAIIMIVVYRKKLRKLRLNMRTDKNTGVGNYGHMAKYYSQYVNDQNRILYSAIFFKIDIDNMSYNEKDNEMKDLINIVAATLKANVTDRDIMARVAADGFAVLKFAPSEKERDSWVKNVMGRLNIYTSQTNPSGSDGVFAGIYSLKADDRNLEEILFKAKKGCFSAAKTGTYMAEYTEEHVRNREEEADIYSGIEAALENNELLVYFHFFIEPRKKKIIGAETLSRWQHPTKGLLLPDKYISLMIRERTISRLDYYMLDKACRFLAHMERPELFFLSCNIAAETFAEPDFLEKCEDIFQKYSFCREELILELGECESMKQDILENAKRLKKLGVTVVLDAFKGHADFLLLEKYEFDGIKIDKSLIDGISTDTGEVVLKSVIEMCHTLGLGILAKGIETEQQANILAELGCDVAQGFYYYQPMPIHEALNILRI